MKKFGIVRIVALMLILLTLAGCTSSSTAKKVRNSGKSDATSECSIMSCQESGETEIDGYARVLRGCPVMFLNGNEGYVYGDEMVHVIAKDENRYKIIIDSEEAWINASLCGPIM